MCGWACWVRKCCCTLLGWEDFHLASPSSLGNQSFTLGCNQVSCTGRGSVDLNAVTWYVLSWQWKGIYSWHFAMRLSWHRTPYSWPEFLTVFWRHVDTTKNSSLFCPFSNWNVILDFPKKGRTRRWAHTSSQYTFAHWRNRILFSYRQDCWTQRQPKSKP